jgi:hypothetical protein
MQMITKERSYDLIELSELDLNIIQCAMSWYQVKLTEQVNKKGYIEERLNCVEEMVDKLNFEEKVNE